MNMIKRGKIMSDKETIRIKQMFKLIPLIIGFRGYYLNN
jgi:hypothetical protein